jgi:multimeric flavodoxin WrbA
MKITVLNGSPKGQTSVTLQYVQYIQKVFPQHELKIQHISQKIRKIEKDTIAFQEIIDEIQLSDGILWATPVYYFLVPSGYKRFIELISEKDAEDVFKNKHTALLTTSIHFFDHAAHNYIHSVCDDLCMRYVGSFSADMYDLLKIKEKNRFHVFAESFFNEIENNSNLSRTYLPVTWRNFDYIPGAVNNKVNPGNRKVLVVTDAEDQQTNLLNMVERFTASFSNDIEVINLHDIDVKGSCMGCLKCAYDNTCAYEGKDGYLPFYNTKIRTADILMFAGTIKDRYLSSRWKLFFDRSFFNGHTPSLIGKQIGFIISGPLSQVSNLRQILESYVEIQHANTAGFITDENGTAEEIDELLEGLAKRVVNYSETGYIRPSTFLGVGGTKLFRDEIWGRLRFPFRADYMAYNKLGTYDFPQKNYKSRIQNAIMLLLSKFPSFRREVNRRMKKEMIKPFEKLLEK